MGLLADVTKRLLGISAYAPAPVDAPSLGDPEVDARREAFGGNLNPFPTTQLRWYRTELEAAIVAADRGDLAQASRLYRAMRRDGTFSGLVSTRSSGLVRLPRNFFGYAEAVAALKSYNETRPVFDEMFPPSELALLAQDGFSLGVGAAELVPVPGRSYPIMIRLEPEFLQFRWNEGRWYFRSSAGLLPITPGDGRWILHAPMGRMSPWQHGQWMACGEAYIQKTHARLYRQNFGGRLANPARVVSAPHGASETQRGNFFSRVVQWGVNSVFELVPGWDMKLLESNGRGHDVWKADEESADKDYMMALAGQIVTSTGGSGFISGDLFKSIRSDLIETDGDGLAYTINTQGLPSFLLEHWGEDALIEGARMQYITKPPKDLNAEASTMIAAASAINGLRDALAHYKRDVDIREICERFSLPITVVEALAENQQSGGTMRVVETEGEEVDLTAIRETIEIAAKHGYRPKGEAIEALLLEAGLEPERIPETAAPAAKLDLAPTDIAKVVRAGEARASRGLPPFGDERDDKTIPELEANAEATGQVEGAEEAAPPEGEPDEPPTKPDEAAA